MKPVGRIWSILWDTRSLQRREFLKLSGGAAVTLANGSWAVGQLAGADKLGDSATFYVSPSGNDNNAGFFEILAAEKADR